MMGAKNLMRDIVRLIATAIVWGMVALIITVAGPHSNDMTALSVVFAIGATISTGMIWQSGVKSQPESQEAVKQKRDRHLTRLVDRLDDEQVYQLEELLASRRDEQYVERQ